MLYVHLNIAYGKKNHFVQLPHEVETLQTTFYALIVWGLIWVLLYLHDCVAYRQARCSSHIQNVQMHMQSTVKVLHVPVINII